MIKSFELPPADLASSLTSLRVTPTTPTRRLPYLANANSFLALGNKNVCRTSSLFTFSASQIAISLSPGPLCAASSFRCSSLAARLLLGRNFLRAPLGAENYFPVSRQLSRISGARNSPSQVGTSVSNFLETFSSRASARKDLIRFFKSVSCHWLRAPISQVILRLPLRNATWLQLRILHSSVGSIGVCRLPKWNALAASSLALFSSSLLKNMTLGPRRFTASLRSSGAASSSSIGKFPTLLIRLSETHRCVAGLLLRPQNPSYEAFRGAVALLFNSCSAPLCLRCLVDAALNQCPCVAARLIRGQFLQKISIWPVADDFAA